MSNVLSELTNAMAVALKDDTTLQSLIGNPIRLYQNTPTPAVYPYAVFGNPQWLPDKAECIDGSEIFPDIHVWSQSRTSTEIEAISGAIFDVLDEADLFMTNHRCVLLERDNARFLRDPDGLTRHSVLTFRALTEPLN